VTQNDAEGKGLWNPVFSKTEFYAEGNTSVVVARDRSGRFRVQLAKNDPRVLIESQLRISQAIGSGLAEVLAAATGAGGIASLLPGVNSTGTGDTGTVPQTSIASESVALDAAAAARRTAIDGLVDQLDAIGGTVRGLAAGANVPADVLQRLRAALEAHKILLTPPAAPSPATTTTTTTSTTSSAGSN
jgi:hypothetical protein